MSDSLVHERRLHEIELAMDAAAEAKAKAADLEERLKRTYAAMFIHHTDQGKSAAAAKEYARASKPYGDLSDEWIAANYEAERLLSKVRANELKVDVWRSINATERERMKLR